MNETTPAPSPADTRGTERQPARAKVSPEVEAAVKYGRVITADVHGNLVLGKEMKHISQTGPEVAPTAGRLN
jgi:hypothetical protein